jgi:predicted O-methyltransferase YrrM
MKESRQLIEILEKNNLNGFNKPGGTDKADVHSYTGVYEHLMSAYKNKKQVNLLEIGVQFGGSSILWQEFLENSKLYLVDVFDQRHQSVIEKLDSDRCKFYTMDAYSEESLSILKSDCPNGFDIVIDDGPHSLESQILCIKHFLPTLNPGGIMIIEDLQSFDWTDELKKHVPEDYQKHIEVFDLRPIKGRYDDILFVIKKPEIE